MTKQIVSTDTAPAAVGPYSQAVIANGMVFTSGQIGLVPGTKDFAGDDLEAQTRQVLTNLEAVLVAAGSGLEHVVKTMVFLADMNDFAAFNAIYAEAFDTAKPARSTVQAAALPLGARVEIEAIALVV
jgi:2-iminobutanoate/2-iminopropanoate deaminase